MNSKYIYKLIFILFLAIPIFSFAQTWKSKANFPGTGTRNSANFVIGCKGYVCFGYNSTSNSKQLWEFEPNSNAWTQKANFPDAARRNGIGFSIGNFGYAGCGFDGSNTYNNMYKYDPSTNTWSTIASYPGSGGRGATATSLNGKAYVSGYGNFGIEFYMYDPILNTWTALTTPPSLGNRTGASLMTFANFIFLGFGHNFNSDLKDFWRYNPTNNGWWNMQNFPGVGRFHPQEFEVDGKLIVGGGFRLGTNATLNDYYAFEPNFYTWTPISNSTITARSASATFTIGKSGFAVAGRGISNNDLIDTWEYSRRISDTLDTLICSNEVLNLDATTARAHYLWQDNSNFPYMVANQNQTYWVDVKVDGCTIRDSLTINYKPLPIFTLGNDTTLCDGDSILLGALFTNATYLWQDNTSSNFIKVKQSGTYWLEVTENGCSFRDSISILYNTKPIVNLGNDTVLCEGESITLNGLNARDYLWSNASTSSSITVVNSGLYWLKVSNGQCESIDTVNITFNSLPNIDLGNDTILCDLKTLNLTSPLNFRSYLWQDNSSNKTFTVRKKGEYWLRVTDSNNCMASDTINIKYKLKPIVNLGNDTILCLGDKINLNVFAEGNSYLWNDGSTRAIFGIIDSGLYSVEVFNQCGKTKDSILIKSEDCKCKLFIPNAFTPNDDSHNNEFKVKGSFFGIESCRLSNFEMYIFDRSGSQIFESKSPDNGWDGTYKGNKVQLGSYPYLIKYTNAEDGKRTQLVGTVTVIL